MHGWELHILRVVLEQDLVLHMKTRGLWSKEKEWQTEKEVLLIKAYCIFL
jgi:hypothetical protein